jgi:hypothetical protein
MRKSIHGILPAGQTNWRCAALAGGWLALGDSLSRWREKMPSTRLGRFDQGDGGMVMAKSGE